MSNLIKGKKHYWEIVIGLEIHAQVKSNSKLLYMIDLQIIKINYH